MSGINNADLRRYLDASPDDFADLSLADLIGERAADTAMAWVAARDARYLDWRRRDSLMRAVKGASDEQIEAHAQATRELRAELKDRWGR